MLYTVTERREERGKKEEAYKTPKSNMKENNTHRSSIKKTFFISTQKKIPRKYCYAVTQPPSH